MLHKAFYKQWHIDNKPSGFEVQDVRFGGLVQRLDTCKKRLIDYANGEIDKLEELEADILTLFDGEKGKPIHYSCYGSVVTANQFTHAL